MKKGTFKESKKAKHERVARILEKLDNKYGTQKRCFLNYRYDWQLLFAVILSAQCTDERVNIVTNDLFVKYKTLNDFACADIKEMERDINSIGLYRAKAKNLILCAKRLLEVYDGKVPSDIDALVSLAGVGRKTANVIRGNIYDIPSIVVDTHVKRISAKLGLTVNEDPVKVENDLMEILPKDHWILWNIDIITLGRTICIARREKCGECFLNKDCPTGIMKNGNSIQAT